MIFKKIEALTKKNKKKHTAQPYCQTHFKGLETEEVTFFKKLLHAKHPAQPHTPF